MLRYFAYGSNINLPYLRKWLADHGVNPNDLSAPRHAILPGYRLRTNYRSSVHEAGACNIEPAKGQVVEGLVMEITPPIHEALLAKEGCPHRYEQTQVEVQVVATGQLLTAMTFVVSPSRSLSIDLPVTQRYRQLILEGAEVGGFSGAYQIQLDTVLRSLQDSLNVTEVTEQSPISN